MAPWSRREQQSPSFGPPEQQKLSSGPNPSCKNIAPRFHGGLPSASLGNVDLLLKEPPDAVASKGFHESQETLCPLAPITPDKSMRTQTISSLEENDSDDNQQTINCLSKKSTPQIPLNAILNGAFMQQETRSNAPQLPDGTLTQNSDSDMEEKNANIGKAYRTTAKNVSKCKTSDVTLKKTNGKDWNIPTPQQPKRKKHRPKVIQEGKLPKTPKAVTPKPARRTRRPVSNSTQSSPHQHTTSPDEDANPQLAGGMEKVTVSNNRRRRSVRRSLTFDLESNPESLITEMDYYTQELNQGTSTSLKTESTVQYEQVEVIVGNTSAAVFLDMDRSQNKMLHADTNIRQHQAELNHSCRRKKPRENPKVLARRKDAIINENQQTNSISEDNSLYLYIHQNQENNAPSYSRADVALVAEDVQKSGTRRKQDNKTTCNLFCPQVHKKRRTMINDCLVEKGKHPFRDYTFIDTKRQAAQESSDTLYIWPFGKLKTKKRSRVPLRASNPRTLAAIIACSRSTSMPDNHDRILRQPTTCIEALCAKSSMKIITKRRTKKQYVHLLTSVYADNNSQRYRSFIEKSPLLLSAQEDFLHVSHSAEYKSTRRLEQSIPASRTSHAIVPYYDPMDNIIQIFKGLSLCEQHRRTIHDRVLVPFVGPGQIVPHETAIAITKKERPRAKVDLDSETNRMWRLLMGKQNYQGEKVDKSKEKWWEDERGVFRGRIESFIARMRLVQGDRRFSKWKGSVVDSVVGVFLTQNVSDHLSSSAFMALAENFPLCSRNGAREEMAGNENSESDAEDGYFQTFSDAIEENPISDLQYYNQSSMHIEKAETTERSEKITKHKVGSSQLQSFSDNMQEDGGRDTDKGQKGGSSTLKVPAELAKSMTLQDSSNRSVMGITPSQFSGVSCENTSGYINGATNRVGSSSDSNSESEEVVNGTKITCLESTSFMELLQIVETTKILEHYRTGSCGEIPRENINVQQRSGSISGTHPSDESVECILKTAHGFNSSASLDSQPRTQQSCADKEASYGKPKSNGHLTEFMDTFSEVDISALQFAEQRAPTSPKNDSNAAIREQTVLGVAQSLVKNKFDKSQKHLNESIGSLYTDSEVVKLNEPDLVDEICTPNKDQSKRISMAKNKIAGRESNDWDSLRKESTGDGYRKGRSTDTMDSLDWDAVRCADEKEISRIIRERGMNNVLAERIKEFLNRLDRDHGSIDLEWLRDTPPDKVKDYLLSIRGLGLKSVECVRLLTLHHLAFPVDTNVGRICVRLGWVPLQPLPESLQLHLLELYPILETIQKYLWPRLCKLDQHTLYELHYHMITFGKVFCTKSKPNCNACPMRAECRHFASAFASARLALPGPQEKSLVTRSKSNVSESDFKAIFGEVALPRLQGSRSLEENSANHPLSKLVSILEYEKDNMQEESCLSDCEPVIEEPTTPQHDSIEIEEIEDAFYEEPDEIPRIELDMKEFRENLQSYMQTRDLEIEDGGLSNALVVLAPEAASIPMPKLKNVSRLRTEHQVYELPDSHPLLEGLERREPDDPSPYLLAIWTPGETAQSTEPPKTCCDTQETGKLCDKKTCFGCNSDREARAQTVRGTLLIPCRTAMRGSFPLNGTYFQVNEVFADHVSSCKPINVPRAWIWNLPRRTVYFGTSVSTIFRGLTTEAIQLCFWRGFVCVRGFDRSTRAPKPLYARLHLPATKGSRSTRMPKKGEADE